MRKKKILLIISIIILFPLSCISEEYVINLDKNYLKDVSFINEDGTYNAIIEIPAGTNEKWEITKDGLTIQREFNSGYPRTIDYLSYPINYGFIPQTLLSEKMGGDGDALDIVIIGERLEKSTIVKVEILGMLSMNDGGLIDNKIISVLSGSKFSRSMSNLNKFRENYPGVLSIIETWFQNYKGYKLETYGYLDKKISKNFILKSNEEFKEK